MKKRLRNLLLQVRGETPTEHLVKMGLKVGENFNRQPGCIIDYSHCWLITIGDNVTLAPGVHILAHDASTKMFLDYTRIGLVEIGNNVFVGAGSIILPNVKVGNNVIIGAGSVVTGDVSDNCLVAGNPARVIRNTTEYIEKNRQRMASRPLYDETWTMKGGVTAGQKEQMIRDLKTGIGYVK